MKDIKQYIKETTDSGIFEAIGDGVSIQTTDFEVLYQNKVHKSFVGEHVGEYCYQAYEKKEDVCEGCPVAKSFKDGKIHKAERSAPTDKGISCFDITASALKDSTGKVIAGIEVVREITERKKSEENLRFHSEILNNIEGGVDLVQVNNGKILFANIKFNKMFGYDSGDLIGKHVSILNAPDSRSAKETSEEIIGFIMKESVWRGEIHNIRKDGTTFWTLASISMFDHYEYGKVLVGVQTDITERKKMENEINKKIKELEDFHDMTVGREIKMKSLKEEIEKLKSELSGYRNNT